jgi:hypothetical protein
MHKKASPPPRVRHSDIAKELEHLYVQLSAVEALIRALEEYRKFYPKLVEQKTKSA